MKTKSRISAVRTGVSAYMDATHSQKKGTGISLLKLVVNCVYRYDIEDITWPRGDTNFIFECCKYLSRVSEVYFIDTDEIST